MMSFLLEQFGQKIMLKKPIIMWFDKYCSMCWFLYSGSSLHRTVEL